MLLSKSDFLNQKLKCTPPAARYCGLWASPLGATAPGKMSHHETRCLDLINVLILYHVYTVLHHSTYNVLSWQEPLKSNLWRQVIPKTRLM